MFKNNEKSFITATMLFFPASAMASGGEVLSLLWLVFLVFVIVVVSLFLSKFSAKQKMTVFFVYLAAALLSAIATSEIHYSKNIYLINTINTAFPLLAWLSVYAYYIKQSKA